ncbi:ABC transporter ATP-binding protein [Actinomadura viridis]|uniref:Lipooligosaccharide transport system ATP-binding protein n=1 Tax=Actinomadura viridis TaxID=58110 RepID=A0A931DE58_9ACTN|nr:ABC transporter ATP-binding protein [Actinomadura viridis]MBG6087174.1 lipooligosaccharide transport system ATP-binding protein [Actinomadura viridis]
MTVQRQATGTGRPEGAETGGRPAVALRGVVKRFGGFTAVDGLDLEVRPGTCLGLLGPNGAGKSTTMKLLTAQALPDGGSIEVLGFAVPRESKRARAAMGVVPQQDNLDEELTARENLEVFAHLYRVPRARRRAAVDDALELAHLTARQRTKVDDLSGGMRRRLLIARGLVHRPALVLLDEPTVGLDPQVRAELWGLIDGLRAGGTTVLMSTHYIEEAERLADECALMSHGRVVARGTPAELIAEHAGELVVEHYGPPGRLAEVERLAHAAGLPTRRTGPSVSVLKAETLPPSLEEELGPDGVRRAANLEDVFVVLTGESVE